MKRKIALSLLALFLFLSSGTILASYYIKNTTDELSSLIKLHQIEDLRKNLILKIQIVQTELYKVRTTSSSSLDSIVSNVTELQRAAENCTSCHHDEPVNSDLSSMRSGISKYQNDLSYYITASANTERIDSLKIEAASVGNELIRMAEEMSYQASSRLSVRTRDAMTGITRAKHIMQVTTLFTFLLGVFIAVRLTLSVTKPAEELVSATKKVASGELGYRVNITDTTEFGKIAENFNAMSLSLKEGYAKLEDEIAERKEAQENLLRSETFLRKTFDSIRDPFCIIDRNYLIVKANEAYAVMKRKKMESIIGKKCYEYFHGRQGICDGCVVEKSFASGDACAHEKQVCLPDGTMAWHEVYTYPIIDSLGTVTHVIDYTRDITERKRIEEALRESRERYALASKGANDGLWDWDLGKGEIYFSPRWKSMLGYEDGDVGGSPEDWTKLVHPDDLQQLESKLASHLEGHTPHFEHEYRIRHKDGTYRWMLSRGLAVYNSEGKAQRIAGSQTDITERKKAEEQLIHDAFHDALTGLPNRALFMDRLRHRLLQSVRSTMRKDTAMFAVLFIDVDRFKVINDSLGHPIGDQLLVQISHRLIQCLRPGDSVARFGGDEFAVLLSEIKDMADVEVISERIQKELQVPFQVNSHEIFSSASIGIAIGSSSYEKAEHIIRDADTAMYQAKANGKSRHEIFVSSMHEKSLKRMQTENEMRRALENREFIMFYQPIYDLKMHKIIGFEALIRWQHPKRGIIYPMEFIPLAEETGLILPLGDWILEEICKQLSMWQVRYPVNPPLKMSVNISGRQFTNRELTQNIARHLEKYQILPGTLAIEITESIIMENAEQAVEMLLQLRSMGVHIHIDDFGTGYSSLSYINKFPVNALKIDRSFITKMSSDLENFEIIKAIVSLAQTLNLYLIAEGLELDEQLEKLRDLKCHYGQGYLFSTPMAPHNLEESLSAELSTLI